MTPAVLRAGLLAACAVACGVRPGPGPVPVEGRRTEMEALVGRWSGRYWVPGDGRRGTLRFELRPGSDTAYKEVEMTFSPALRLYREAADEDLPRQPCNIIDIAVVRLDGPKIRGTLAPYWDPDCDCRTLTVFEGELSGQRVQGSFTSRARAGRTDATQRTLVRRSSTSAEQAVTAPSRVPVARDPRDASRLQMTDHS